VAWGDNSSDSVLTASAQGSLGSATHTYTEEGTYTVTVTVRDGNGDTSQASFHVAVADAALQGTATPVNAVEGQAVTNVQVATFTDADPAGTANDYTATVRWGDGETSTGSISASGNGFVVTASKPHPYAEQGSYTVQVSIQDAGGATTDVTTISAGTVSTFAAPVGLDYPQGMAMDGSGNLYVANIQSGTITRITPAGVASTFASGLNGPTGLAFDSSGNLYVANAWTNSVIEITPAGALSAFVASGLDNPQGLAFDASGDLYVANYYNNTVSEVTPGGVVSTFVSSGLTNPVGLSFDSSGNLYVANFGANSVSKVTPGGVFD
jgi:glucose/arabinose dehydrogenase